MYPDPSTGLEAAYLAIEAAINADPTIQPKCDGTPLAPMHSPIPATYLSWEDEEFDSQTGDLKWIHPLNSRSMLVLRRYVHEDSTGVSMAVQLIRFAAKIEAIIQTLTARTDIEFKCRVIKVVPTYNYEARTWGALEFFIQVGEYYE